MTQAHVLASYDQPDWSTLAEDVHCPLCGYNLRGLSEPRCPECGYRFAWRDLLDPTRRRHPYLFEHHPEHNVRSFLYTVTRKLRPFEFWKSLRPDQPANRRRLLVYWIVVAVGALLPVPLIWSVLIHDFYAYNWSGWGESAAGFVWLNDYGRALTLGPLAMATWPVLDFLVLLLFHESMRRAKTKPEHVWRCAVYSGDIAFWVGLAVAVSFIWFDRGGDRWGLVVLGIFAGGFLIHFARLVSAYRHYLKFHAPFFTILAAQVIAVLAWAAALALG